MGSYQEPGGQHYAGHEVLRKSLGHDRRPKSPCDGRNVRSERFRWLAFYTSVGINHILRSICKQVLGAFASQHPFDSMNKNTRVAMSTIALK
jgi:hypothetical protein